MPRPVVRRVRVHEWAEVRDLRVAAVSDPDAALAFLTTPPQERAHSDAYWRDRAARLALGEDSAQFVAVTGDAWVGTATVLLREESPGRARRADVVGVWIAPASRGAGILGRLMDAAQEWAASHGAPSLTLTVHRDNVRAEAAYRKIGFVPTGATFTSSVGPEIEMRRSR